MKRKRIQYNELNEDIYVPTTWTRPKLIAIGTALLFFGFLFNFSLEEKINKLLLSTLSTNEACPIVFDKAEVSYLLPKIVIKKPVVLGSCFGQVNNRLPLQNITISLSAPSFYPPGIKLHAAIVSGKTNLNLYPVISPFSQIVEFRDSVIDTQLFAAMTSDNVSPVAGILRLDGFLKIESGALSEGKIDITSRNFNLPAQNIKGFELTLLNLKTLNVAIRIIDKSSMLIDQLVLGEPGAPMEMKLKGKMAINPNNFLSSLLQLSGTLHLSNYMLVNFSFLKLFLPQENTSGTYQMKINGPLGNLGQPQFE